MNFGTLFSATVLVWTAAASAVVLPTPDDQEHPAVAGHPNGYFVVWADKRNYATNEYDIYGARVSAAGKLLDPGGIAICTAAGRQTSPKVAFDGRNFLIAWEDDRESTSAGLLYQIYGARVATNGVVLDPDGFKITANHITCTAPAVASNGKGFFVVWVDWHRTTGAIADLYGSPVSSDGVVSNPDGIPLVLAPNWQCDPRIASLNGEYLATYFKQHRPERRQ